MTIFITGCGVNSSLGLNYEENLTALINKKSGIKNFGENIFFNHNVGKIDFSNEELIKKYDLKEYGSRTAILGAIAAKEAFMEHVISDEIRTGLISGTSVGGMDITEKNYLPFKNNLIDPSIFNLHVSGNTSNYIANELGLTNIYINTLSTACSSAANAIMIGARMIQQNILDRVIVGGTDCLTDFTFNGFKSLMIFDKEWCKPFDENRNGLNLGEGAGFLILESEKSIEKSKKNPIAKLSGWNSSSDAYHQTASSPDGIGAIMSMTKALNMAKLNPDQIDYISAHGTSTPNNDQSESVAFINTFKNKVPHFSSTKSYTGHTLAASGGIEGVFSIMSLKHDLLFPNLNFKSPIIETNLTPITEVIKDKKINHILSNSFGFGGNNSTLIFSKI